MAEQESQGERQIGIQRVYLKDFSFESPHTPQIFTNDDNLSPKTELNIRSSHKQGTENSHEVVLTITVETKHEDRTLFLIELHQAGLFHIAGYDGEEFSAIIGSFCPSVLFPYARESIASMVTKGGFPDFTLQPINFDALYAQSRQQQAETEVKPEGGASIAGNGGAH